MSVTRATRGVGFQSQIVGLTRTNRGVGFRSDRLPERLEVVAPRLLDAQVRVDRGVPAVRALRLGLMRVWDLVFGRSGVRVWGL